MGPAVSPFAPFKDALVTQIEEVGPFERMLTLSIDAGSLAAGRRSAAARLSKETKIKGFRPGKAPVKVVESIIGSERLDREAVDDALPKVLADAIIEADLRPVVYPRLLDVRHHEWGAEVDVLITLWPEVDRLPEYRGRSIAVKREAVTDEDVDEQIEHMRDQFAELDEVNREGFDGDFVLIDLRTSVGGEEIGEGSTTDLMYEIGSGSLYEGMDEALRGTGTGGIVEFQTALPEVFGERGGQQASVRILVKRVLAKRLPELTDEWVEDVSEFASVEEMRERLAVEIQEILDRRLWVRLEQSLLAELVEDLELELPDALVAAEMDAVLHRFVHRLERQGIDLEQYLELTGQDPEQLRSDLRSQAEANLRTRILLEAVAEAEGLDISADEIEHEISALAAATGVDETDYRSALTEGGHEETLAGDILRRKAVDRLLDLVVAVDESGEEIELPERRSTDPAGHDEAPVHSPVGDDEPAAMEVTE